MSPQENSRRAGILNKNDLYFYSLEDLIYSAQIIWTAFLIYLADFFNLLEQWYFSII